MNAGRLAAVARREGLIVVRDIRTLIMGFAMPVVLLVIFGGAISFDVDHLSMALCDLDRTAESRDVMSTVTASDVFDVVASTSLDSARGLVGTGRANLALIVPRGFSRDAARGRSHRLWVILDGSDAMVSSLALTYLDLLAARMSGIVPPVDARVRFLYNPDQRSAVAIVPGLTAVILVLLGGILTSLVIAREEERGTLEWLLTTPVRPSEMVIGKAIPYFAIGLFDALLALAVGVYVFGVPLRGDLWLYLFSAVLFLTCALSLGLLLSANFRSQQVAYAAAMIVTFLPSYLLSGFAFPIENMPKAVQAITYLVPARYFVSIAREIQLKGSGFGEIASSIATLAVFSTVLLTLAVKRSRRRLD